MTKENKNPPNCDDIVKNIYQNDPLNNSLPSDLYTKPKQGSNETYACNLTPRISLEDCHSSLEHDVENTKEKNVFKSKK